MFEAMAFKFHLIFIKHQTFNFKLKKASACDERPAMNEKNSCREAGVF